MRRLLIIVLASISLGISAQSVHSFPVRDSLRNYVRLLFTGDAMQHSPQFKLAWNSKTRSYNYEPNFRYLKSYIKSADVNIINVETTFPGSDYCGYPRFRTPDPFFHAMVDAGFQVFAVANNHILDSGSKGLQRTLNLMKDHLTMGAYLNQQERVAHYPIVVQVGAIKIALFNATYGTNDLKPAKPNSVNYINKKQIEQDMATSLQDSTIDLHIMYIHWGTEYELAYNAEQHKMAQWLANLGFDAIIGSHPHVVQGVELLQSSDGRLVPVAYSLGNLISNQRWQNANGGAMALLDIDVETKELLSLDIIPVYVHKGRLGGKGDADYPNTNNYYCIPTTDYLDGKLPFYLPSKEVNELKIHHQNTTKRTKRK